ncbi:hypothetical protein [Glycomyces paridis]|uniref:Aldose 1-epimerase n=1 Tax=Glycomyces paridis TaxID=2126555 RepID=A0A4S8PG47_9ACTN|nr:hypothetical protein [Glycomyces paridis]THV29487.1 hypothetical protein E9998_08210 [Glycomyces paridis]
MTHRIESGSYTATVDPVGARIASIVHRPTGTEFLLRTPWQDEDWGGAYPSTRSNEEWHRRYPGGWHTLVPHAGDARTLDGVEHPFHGEAAWRRWRTVEHTTDSCTLEIALRTVPLTVRRSVTATATGLEVAQRATNHSGSATAFGWCEHPAFGPALIGPDTTVRLGDDPLPVRFPAAGASGSGFLDVPTKSRSSATIRNPANGTEATLHFDPDLFSHLHVWQEHRATPGFPWWGAVDTVALEPASDPYESDGGPLGSLALPGHGSLAATFTLDLSIEESR